MFCEATEGAQCTRPAQKVASALATYAEVCAFTGEKIACYSLARPSMCLLDYVLDMLIGEGYECLKLL